MQGWTTRTSALLLEHRDDPLDTMVHSAAYGADLVVEVCREEDDDWELGAQSKRRTVRLIYCTPIVAEYVRSLTVIGTRLQRPGGRAARGCPT